MKNRLFPTLIWLICLIGQGAEPSQVKSSGGQFHVVLVVFDGMRPDFISETNTPVLWKLATAGVNFLNHHSVYVSATEVNGTAINTGAYPANNGVVGNSEYRPAIDPLRAVHLEALETVRKGDRISGGHYLKMPTLAEIVQETGKKTAVAGAKPIGLLPDRAERATAERGATVFAGATLPAGLLADLTASLGAFPPDTAKKPTRNDWTTSVLLDHLWVEEAPAFSLLWLNQPDLSQHTTGPGSPTSLAGIKNADENLGRVLEVLEKKGLRDSTDIILVSDHGFSTVAGTCDLAAALEKSGVKAKREFKGHPMDGEVLVAAHSGSSFIYVIGHEEKTIERIVTFLQSWEFTGVIFTRKALAGTFALHQVHLDSADAPDIVISMRWTGEPSRYGAPGMLYGDKVPFGSGQGSHCSLSRFDMHATLIAAGPHFRSGMKSSLPTGNVDIEPTILHLLGVNPPKKLDGRILTEALNEHSSTVPAREPRRIEATAKHENESFIWRQYLQISEVNGVQYFDEGNGAQGR